MERKFCGNCGSPIESDDVFCFHCGGKTDAYQGASPPTESQGNSEITERIDRVEADAVSAKESQEPARQEPKPAETPPMEVSPEPDSTVHSASPAEPKQPQQPAPGTREQTEPQTAAAAKPSALRGKNLPLLIGAGALVVVLAVAGFFFLRGKEPSDPKNNVPAASSAAVAAAKTPDPRADASATVIDIAGEWTGTLKVENRTTNMSTDEMHDLMQKMMKKFQDHDWSKDPLYGASKEELAQKVAAMDEGIPLGANYPAVLTIEPDGKWSLTCTDMKGFRLSSHQMPIDEGSMDDEAMQSTVENEISEGAGVEDVMNKYATGEKVILLKDGAWSIQHTLQDGGLMDMDFSGIVIDNQGKPNLEARLLSTFKLPLLYNGPAKTLDEVQQNLDEAIQYIDFYEITTEYAIVFQDLNNLGAGTQSVSGDPATETTDDPNNPNASTTPSSGNLTAAGQGAKPSSSAQQPANHPTASSGSNPSSGGQSASAGTSGQQSNAPSNTASFEAEGEWAVLVESSYNLQYETGGDYEYAWYEEVYCNAFLTQISGERYKLTLTPISYYSDGEQYDFDSVREGPLEYEAIVSGDTISFTLESELFARKDGYDQGMINPFAVELQVGFYNNTLYGGEAQVIEKMFDGYPAQIRINTSFSKYD